MLLIQRPLPLLTQCRLILFPTGSTLNYSVRQGNALEVQGILGDQDVVDFAGIERFTSGLGPFGDFLDPTRISSIAGAAGNIGAGATPASIATTGVQALEPRVQHLLRILHRWKDQAEPLAVFNLIWDNPDLSSQDNSRYIIERIVTNSSPRYGLNAGVSVLIREVRLADNEGDLGLFGRTLFQDSFSTGSSLLRGFF